MKLDVRLNRDDIAAAISLYLESKYGIYVNTSHIRFKTVESSSDKFITEIEAYYVI